MPLEGIVTLSTPGGNSQVGRFTLPKEFDSKTLSANWVEAGPKVEAAREIQPILGTTKGAVGWEVWRFPEGHKQKGKPHKVNDGKHEYVLMCRKKTISENVNGIYGNVSKRFLMRAQTGDVLGDGGQVTDPGLLNHQRMQRAGYKDFGDDYEMNVPQNHETTAPQVAAEPDATGES